MKTNFHTHVQRCRHADGNAEDYIKSALQAGVSQLGFSDHGPFPEIDFGMRMPFCELKDYVDELKALTAKYQADIILWKGLEIEYLPEFNGYYEELFHKWDIDYLLMGEHFYKSSDGKTANITEAASTAQYLDYARTVAEGMRTGFFQAIAHPDIFMMAPFAWDDNCRRSADLIIDTAVATGVMLEYNANGFRRGQKRFPDGTRYQYPHEAFWEMAAEAPVKVIIGSDCHNPAQVWDDAMELALCRLRSLGITPIMQLMEP